MEAMVVYFQSPLVDIPEPKIQEGRRHVALEDVRSILRAYRDKDAHSYVPDFVVHEHMRGTARLWRRHWIEVYKEVDAALNGLVKRSEAMMQYGVAPGPMVVFPMYLLLWDAGADAAKSCRPRHK